MKLWAETSLEFMGVTWIIVVANGYPRFDNITGAPILY
jgi:hypothetical protein